MGVCALCGAANRDTKAFLSLDEAPHPAGAPNLRLKASRVAQRRKLNPTAPNHWWGIDMNKVLINGFGWGYLFLILDWYTKKIVGHYGGIQAKTWHWLVALNATVQQQFPEGAKDHRLSLMPDNGG
jgi:putative transposase